MSGTELTHVGQLALLVTEVAAAERFYRDVLTLEHLFTFGDLTFFRCGSTRLFLRAVPAAEWSVGSTVYFAVDDLDATCARLASDGVRFTAPSQLIHRHEDGAEEWMAFFDDPDGNSLALMTRRGASASSDD